MPTIPVYEWQPTTTRVAMSTGIEPAAVLRFDHNTSVDAPPWVGEEAVRSVGSINEYPEADYARIRAAIADYHGVAADMVVPGAGADELISLCAQTFLRPGERAASDSPTYPLYRIATLRRGCTYREAPRGEDLGYPASELAAVAGHSALTWLCVPSNPLGDRPAQSRVEKVISAAGGTVVVDAAYAEYAGDRWARAVAEHENLIVLGTFSKAFGLAGIRVGYAIAHPERAAALEAARPPGSVSTVSAALAQRALADLEWMRSNVERTVAARADLEAKLRSLGLLPRPSVTNFLLTPVGSGARDAAARLIGKGIVVRSFPQAHPLAEALRFTVRSPSDHDRLVTSLEEALK